LNESPARARIPCRSMATSIPRARPPSRHTLEVLKEARQGCRLRTAARPKA
jgi:hypothetical protein